MVEVTGLEPAASWSQTKHSTKLSYTSKLPLSVLSDNEQFYYITDSRFCQVFFQQATKKSLKIALWQYHTKIVRQMRRQIFRQMKQKAE